MLRPLARLFSDHADDRACSACGRDFLCPMDWEPEDDEHWCIEARCGACGLWHRLHLTNAQAAAWDVELDAQMLPIARAWQRLDRERMAREVEGFVTALERDLIDAVDFS